MSPQTSALRNTQKIRRWREIEAVADPTVRFFLEGDELEAEARKAGNDNAGRDTGPQRDTLVLNDRDLGALDSYRHFETRARARGALIGVALLSSLGAIGVAAWMWMSMPARPGLDWFRQRPAAKTEAAIATPPAQSQIPDVTAKPAAIAPIVEPITSGNDDPDHEPVPPGSEDPDPESTGARGQHPNGNGKALRGYVWSPAAKAMVSAREPGQDRGQEPNERAARPPVRTTETARVPEPPAAPANPDAPMPSSLLQGPGIAAPSTGPAPDENARVPTTQPAPFEPSPAPAKSSAPIIE